ncbi:MAG: 3-deoxy-7-phosphoheptulonate synthase [Peptoniphilaceae bacterium]|nr:3-deoxy-7-phosphoheptulonate synthase [Peptoniphilaceae bacterium]MDY6086289.1 3-deoxy-7-phosphoheptulonate synthase [Peptoniphilaceae bacterium]
MKITPLNKLPEPLDIRKRYPLSDEAIATQRAIVREIEDVLSGKDDRILLVIGPCSADREAPVLEYLERLARLRDEVKDCVLIIPRIYTNKPRTRGTGYKGMAESPDPTKGPDLLSGIIAIRKIHMRALLDFGFSGADEMLYPENHAYLDDLLSYVAVGARSVENQQHRLTSSGVGIPVGMKNPTSGELSVMINAIYAAQQPQDFEYRGWAYRSEGNPYAHAILRGYVTPGSASGANYHYEDLKRLAELYDREGLVNPAVIVDVNHANSAKHFLEQPRIVEEVMHNRRRDVDVKHLVKGFMIESYLVDGHQDVDGTTFGQSITDPCLGWEKTETLVRAVADGVDRGRR